MREAKRSERWFAIASALHEASKIALGASKLEIRDPRSEAFEIAFAGLRTAMSDAVSEINAIEMARSVEVRRR